MAHRSSSLLLMVLVGAYVAAVSVAMPSMIPSDVSLGRAPKDARVMVHVTLKHDNDESKKKLDDTFWAVSDPASPQVGQYISMSELGELMKPRAETVAAVKQWLSSNGVNSKSYHMSPWQRHVFVVTNVATAEALLQTEVHMYPTPSRDVTKPRTTNARKVAPHAPVLLAPKTAVPESHPLASAFSRVVMTTVLEDTATRAALRSTLSRRLKEQQQAAEEEEQAKLQAAAAEADELAQYPFTFWPPSPFAAVEVLASGSVLLETVVTCPSPAWAHQDFPVLESKFTSGDINLPPQDSVFEACGAEVGALESYTVTFKGTDGTTYTETWDYEPVTDGRGCLAREFGVPICQETEGCTPKYVHPYSLGLCLFEVNPPLTLDVPYTVELGAKFANKAEPLWSTYMGFPAKTNLQIVKATAKTPSVLNQQYNIPKDPIACAKDNQQAIGVLQDSDSGFYSYADLTQFYSDVGISTTNQNMVKFVSSLNSNSSFAQFLDSNGLLQQTQTITNVQSNPGGETTLDVQWISSMAPGAWTTVWHGGYLQLVGQDGLVQQADPMFTVLVAVEYAVDAPKVLSLSYGGPEPEKEAIQQFEMLFQGLAAVGVTTIAASGDQGATFSDISATNTCAKFNPSYPATSAYVTAVGATQLLKTGDSVDEVVCSIQTGALITSGGGFSNQIARPSWQDNAVQDWISQHASGNPPTGRGYPDVAVFGHQFEIVQNKQSTIVDGTSASTPSFAGMVTLWNDYLLSRGKPQLGFLNMKLYAATPQSSHFNDITVGNNYCVGQSATDVCCSTGYDATTGWDPVSGLGSPKFDMLAQSMLGASWTKGGCTIAQRSCEMTCSSVCDTDGICGTSMPIWEIVLIAAGSLLGLVVIIVLFCCCCRASNTGKQTALVTLPDGRTEYVKM